MTVQEDSASLTMLSHNAVTVILKYWCHTSYESRHKKTSFTFVIGDRYVCICCCKLNPGVFRSYLEKRIRVYDTKSSENQHFAYAKTKTQISFEVTAKLISAFDFATWIVQDLYFLNTQF